MVSSPGSVRFRRVLFFLLVVFVWNGRCLGSALAASPTTTTSSRSSSAGVTSSSTRIRAASANNMALLRQAQQERVQAQTTKALPDVGSSATSTSSNNNHHRRLETTQTILMTLTLAVPKQTAPSPSARSSIRMTSNATFTTTATTPTSTTANVGSVQRPVHDGDFETYLCHLDSFWTEHLSTLKNGDAVLFQGQYGSWTRANHKIRSRVRKQNNNNNNNNKNNTNSNGAGNDGGGNGNGNGNGASSAAEQDEELMEITLQVGASHVQSETTIAALDATELLTMLKTSVTNEDVTKALQASLPADNYFRHATTTYNVKLHTTSARVDTEGSTYFSTANCGVAVITLNYDFFDDVDPAQWIPQAAEVENLLCRTHDYYSTVFARYSALGSGGATFGQAGGVELVLDHIHWTLDDTAVMPFSIKMEARASKMPNHRQIAPMDVMEWMQVSDFATYIQTAVWLEEEGSQDMFFNVNSVTFHGTTQYLDQEQLMTEEEGPLSTTFTTKWCLDGVAVGPQAVLATTSEAAAVTDDSSHADKNETAQDEEQAEESREEVSSVTTYELEYSFFDGNARAPTSEELEGLLCQTAYYYSTLLLSSTQTNMMQGQREQPIVSDFEMTSQEWHYAETNGTLMVWFDTKAWDARGQRVAPATIMKAMENVNIDAYIMEYVWKTEEEGSENLFYHTNGVKLRGYMRELNNASAGEVDELVVYSSKECPRFMDTEGLKENDQPSINMTQCIHLLSKADSNQDVALSQEEFVLFVNNLTHNGHNNHSFHYFWALPDAVRNTFTTYASNTGEYIDLHGGEDAQHTLCKETEEALKSYNEPPPGSSGGVGLHYLSNFSELSGALDIPSQEVTVNTSFVVASPQGVPVNQTELNNAFSVFVKNLRTGRRFLQQNPGFHTDMAETETATVDSVVPVECSESGDLYLGDLDCYEASAHYNVLVMGAHDNPAAVAATYSSSTYEAIEEGLLEESLMQVNPESPVDIVPDPSRPPPPEQAPETVIHGAATVPGIHLPQASKQKESLSLGALISITIGAILLLVLLSVSLYLYFKHQETSREKARKERDSNIHKSELLRELFSEDEEQQRDGVGSKGTYEHPDPTAGSEEEEISEKRNDWIPEREHSFARALNDYARERRESEITVPEGIQSPPDTSEATAEGDAKLDGSESHVAEEVSEVTAEGNAQLDASETHAAENANETTVEGQATLDASETHVPEKATEATAEGDSKLDASETQIEKKASETTADGDAKLLDASESQQVAEKASEATVEAEANLDAIDSQVAAKPVKSRRKSKKKKGRKWNSYNIIIPSTFQSLGILAISIESL